MESPPASFLLARRGFLAFFTTQLLSAFNDNFFKNALVIWISARQASLFGVSPAAMISLCSLIFIAPFFVLSASAGQLADRYEKTLVARAVKVAEVLIMGLATAGFLSGSLGIMVSALFLMGVHSAVLGPVKYSILPELLENERLVEGNALVEMGTFLAILGGTIGGGVLILWQPNGAAYVSAALMLLAVVGLGTSFGIPRLPPSNPTLPVHTNPIAPTIQTLRILKRTRAVFLAALGISWFWFLGAVLLSLLPVYARETLHAHEHVVTLFMCVFCVGIALGSLLTERISGKNLELGLVPFGSLGMTAFLFDLYLIGEPASLPTTLLDVHGFLALPHAYRVLFDLFAIAVFGGFFTVPLYTLMQERAEPNERARVVAGNNILNALFMVIGSALLAFLFAKDFSVHNVFLVLACLSILAGIYIYSLLPEFLLRFLAWILGRTLYRVRIAGHDNIPKTGPVVVVCNHVAFNDPLIVAGALRRPARFVMDHNFFNTPLLSILFKQGKAIPIAPLHEDPALLESAFSKIAAELREGELVCIYPEGKITKTGEMNPFKLGIERIVHETPVPVVPMAVYGLWGSMFSRKGGPAMKKLPKRFRARLTIKIGEAIPAAQVSAALLEERVRRLLAEAEALTK
jgi:1-acyl-sn-glycerol-3-phosphate acyltransferase